MYSRERAGSSKSAALYGAPLLVEFIPAVAGYGDFQGAMILLEQVKAFAEIAPKREQFRLVRVTLCKRFKSVFGQLSRKYLDGDMPLARCVNLDGQPVDFFDPFIGDGNASNGHAISMKENVSPGIRMRAENSVRAIWVADVQAQKKIALWIEPIEFVEPLWHLHVAKFSFRPKHSGSRTNRAGVDENVRIAGIVRRPELEARLFLEGAEQNGTRRIRNLFFFTHAPKSIALLLGRGADSRVLKLPVAEGPNFLSGNRSQKKESYGQETDGLHGQSLSGSDKNTFAGAVPARIIHRRASVAGRKSE
jgi:hypothetical protein